MFATCVNILTLPPNKVFNKIKLHLQYDCQINDLMCATSMGMFSVDRSLQFCLLFRLFHPMGKRFKVKMNKKISTTNFVWVHISNFKSMKYFDTSLLNTTWITDLYYINWSKLNDVDYKLPDFFISTSAPSTNPKSLQPSDQTGIIHLKK